MFRHEAEMRGSKRQARGGCKRTAAAVLEAEVAQKGRTERGRMLLKDINICYVTQTRLTMAVPAPAPRRGSGSTPPLRVP